MARQRATLAYIDREVHVAFDICIASANGTLYLVAYTMDVGSVAGKKNHTKQHTKIKALSFRLLGSNSFKGRPRPSIESVGGSGGGSLLMDAVGWCQSDREVL